MSRYLYLELLATLVHEMTHLEQEEFGKPSKGGHHNMEWANLMIRVGLTPTDTGNEGGKMTGRNVTHMIDPDGPFAAALADLMPFDIPYFTQPITKAEKKKNLSKLAAAYGTISDKEYLLRINSILKDEL